MDLFGDKIDQRGEALQRTKNDNFFLFSLLI